VGFAVPVVERNRFERRRSSVGDPFLPILPHQIRQPNVGVG
jgi:hypothetical protein